MVEESGSRTVGWVGTYLLLCGDSSKGRTGVVAAALEARCSQQKWRRRTSTCTHMALLVPTRNVDAVRSYFWPHFERVSTTTSVEDDLSRTIILVTDFHPHCSCA